MARLPPVTTTETIEKAMKFTGSPQKLPTLTARRLGAKREKSQKLSIRVEKYATVSEMAAKNSWAIWPPVRCLLLKLKLFWPCDRIRTHTARISMTTQIAG